MKICFVIYILKLMPTVEPVENWIDNKCAVFYVLPIYCAANDYPNVVHFCGNRDGSSWDNHASTVAVGSVFQDELTL